MMEIIEEEDNDESMNKDEQCSRVHYNIGTSELVNNINRVHLPSSSLPHSNNIFVINQLNQEKETKLK